MKKPMIWYNGELVQLSGKIKPENVHDKHAKWDKSDDGHMICITRGQTYLVEGREA